MNHFAVLSPKSAHWGQAMAAELIGTFFFVTSVLIVKEPRSGFFTASVGVVGVGFFGCAIIAAGLTAMILTMGGISGASLNPAVSISQTWLVQNIIGVSGYSLSFWRIYMFGPILGGILAGLFSLVHGAALDNWAGLQIEEDEQQDDNAIKVD